VVKAARRDACAEPPILRRSPLRSTESITRSTRHDHGAGLNAGRGAWAAQGGGAVPERGYDDGRAANGRRVQAGAASPGTSGKSRAPPRSPPRQPPARWAGEQRRAAQREALSASKRPIRDEDCRSTSLGYRHCNRCRGCTWIYRNGCSPSWWFRWTTTRRYQIPRVHCCYRVSTLRKLRRADRHTCRRGSGTGRQQRLLCQQVRTEHEVHRTARHSGAPGNGGHRDPQSGRLIGLENVSPRGNVHCQCVADSSALVGANINTSVGHSGGTKQVRTPVN